MAKIGGPSLPPVIPRPQAPGETGKAGPVAPRSQPGAAPQQPHAPEPVTLQAQQVAQQFGSAFMSAGRLASQLVKGLVTPPSAQPRRTEKPSAERVDDGKGEPQHAEGEHGPNEAGERNPLMSAFAALKRTRLFRFRKARKLRAGRSQATTSIVLDDDYNEQERNHQHARSWLGEDQEETSYNQAKREALLLQHLERQGEPPTSIARQLNSHLGVGQDREFKHLLTDQVRPQMEAMADQVPSVSTEERRALAALVSRAAYQVGVRSAATFTKLLASAGAAEAAQLSASSEAVVVRAAQFEQALRRAASPAYRAALVEAGHGSLERLAGDAARQAPEERLLTWVSLLRAAGSLELESLPSMAEAVVGGVLGTGGSHAAGALAEVLGPALRLAPGGGSWAVQLIVTLAARGEVEAAEKLADALREELSQARAGCLPLLKSLRELRAGPSGAAGGEKDLLSALEGPGLLLASLIPACAQVLEKDQALPLGAGALTAEAVLCLAPLHTVAATAPGQHLLRRALLAQERGSQTFLSILPRVAQTLGNPKLVRPLWDNGLTPAHYQPAGRPFLEQTALHTGRALAGPVVARSQKGDASAAKVLLRSAVRGNAALFGLTADGARHAADALEALRDKPGPESLRRTLLRLSKIRKQHPLEKKPSGAESLQALATLLAARESGLPSQAPGGRPRQPTGLTALEVAADQSAHAKKKAPPREAPARTPKPPAGGVPRSGE
jgi:hypothetical protein